MRRRRRPDALRRVARRIELLAAASAARTRTAQSLSASASFSTGVASGAVAGERRQRGGPRDVRRVALPDRYASASAAAPSGRLQLAERRAPPRRARPRSSAVSRAEQDRRRRRAPSAARAPQHRRNDPLVGVVEHRAQPRQRRFRRQRAEHRRQRGPHAPVGSGSSPDSTVTKPSGSSCASARSAAARIGGLGSASSVEQRVDDARRRRCSPSAVTASSRSVRIGLRRLNQRRAAAAPPRRRRAGQRADRLDRHHRGPAPVTSGISAAPPRDPSASRAPWRQTRACTGADRSSSVSSAGSARGSSSRCSA